MTPPFPPPPEPTLMRRLGRLAGRGRTAMLARVYLDRGRDPRDAVCVLGTARSGTTWLGDLVAQALGARVVFEPFNPELVPGAAPFGLMPYRRPEDDDPELLAFCRTAFSGALRGPWVDRDCRRLLPSGRVVKCVRANLIAGWLRAHFPEVPCILLVRRPDAVVNSRLRLGWSADGDLRAMLGDPRLIGDHLAEHEEWARSLRTEEERTALVWAIHYLVALRQLQPSGGAHVVFYEDLRAEPAAGLAEIIAHVGRPARRLSGRQLRRPSSTARGGKRADAYGARRTTDEVDGARVRDVVERFGLGWIYRSGTGPTAEARARLADAMRSAGPRHLREATIP